MARITLKNCVVELGSQAITGELNEVTINASRAVMTALGFGDDAMEKDVDAKDESVDFAGYYTEGATDAMKELSDLYDTPGSGETLNIYPDGKTAGKKYFTGTAFVADRPVTLTRGQYGAIKVTMPINGALTWGTYSTA